MQNDSLRKLTEDARSAITASIASAAVESLISKTKSSNDSDAGSFKVVISTADQDRQGESVIQNGWDLTFYKQNPIVLWAHDYSALPIGVATSIEVRDGKLVAEGKFAPSEANPFAQQVRKLYELGMVNTTSVGFIAKEFDGEKSGVITKAELLEFSFVPVPANPYALRLNQIKDLGIDVGMLKVKGIEIKEEADVKGPVNDQVNVLEAREAKYQKYMEICEVMDAFCSVYFDEKTAVDAFPTLLNETIEILKTVAGGQPDDTQKAIEKFVDGRKNLTLITLQNIQALSSILRNEVALGKKTEGDKGIEDKNTNNKGRKNSAALNEVNDFVETRELLRSIDNSVEKALRNFNMAARDRQ